MPWTTAFRGNDWPGQSTVPHVGQSLGIDHVICMTGAQEFQEVQPALGSGGGEGGEMVVADLGTGTLAALMASSGVIDRDPGCAPPDRPAARRGPRSGTHPGPHSRGAGSDAWRS